MKEENDYLTDVINGINVTPMVDIMLVLLVIFMVTASFVNESSIKINLPKAQSSVSSGEKTLEIRIDNNGFIFLENKKLDIEALKNILTYGYKNNPNIKVIIMADKTLKYQKIIEIIDIVKISGITKVGLGCEK